MPDARPKIAWRTGTCRSSPALGPVLTKDMAPAIVCSCAWAEILPDPERLERCAVPCANADRPISVAAYHFEQVVDTWGRERRLRGGGPSNAVDRVLRNLPEAVLQLTKQQTWLSLPMSFPLRLALQFPRCHGHAFLSVLRSRQRQRCPQLLHGQLRDFDRNVSISRSLPGTSPPVALRSGVYSGRRIGGAWNVPAPPAVADANGSWPRIQESGSEMPTISEFGAQADTCRRSPMT